MHSATPICDFVSAYRNSGAERLHMPGHKGAGYLGCEPYDITEIDGADALYEASGIIGESERIAGQHFGSHTFYSTEGSSLAIRAMLFLAAQRSRGKRARVLAARNVHRTFLSAAALLDLEVTWLYPGRSDSYLSANVTADAIECALTAESYCAVYLTSPDYLGRTLDLEPIAKVCHRHRVPLLVDNAHGAYLKFLPVSRHPIDLGADLCCDSAHKTLPALTGAAYLHVAQDDAYGFAAHAKDAMALFGSTSPSYLILQSLDTLNRYLDTYPEQLSAFVEKVDRTKAELTAAGYALIGDEPLKITIDANAYGYTGKELVEQLIAQKLVPEFSDPEFLVLMLTPQNSEQALPRLVSALTALPAKRPVPRGDFPARIPEIAMSVREAMLGESEWIPVGQSAGRVLASPCVGCPPAVPILMCGERIDPTAVQMFRFYGFERVKVVKS